MLNFYAISIAALSAGTVAYLLGASLEWERHRKTIREYNELAHYANAVTIEVSGLRAASKAENAVGSRHPSLARRPHLLLVK
jgi:hypothetical protein